MHSKLKKDKMENSKESPILTKLKKTRTATGFIYSFILTTITLLTTMTVSFLVMLFSSGEDGKRYCFFDTIYFESLTGSDGSIEMAFGLTGEYVPIIIIWCSIMFFCSVVFVR